MFDDKREAPAVDSAAVAKKAVAAAKVAVADDQIVKIRNHSGLSSLVLGDGTVVRFHQGAGTVKAKHLVEVIAQGCTVETESAIAPAKNELTDAQKAELEKVFGKAE
jgi:hypothetical protein